MDRLVRIAIRRSPSARWLRSSFFGCIVGRALGFAAEVLRGRSGWQRTGRAARTRDSGFGHSDRPSCPTLCRALVPPNNAFKPTPLRGAA